MLNSGSLKEKRHVVKAITSGLQTRFHVAAAEVEHQDLWQRTAIGVTCVSESAFHVSKILSEVERYVASDDRVEMLNADIDVRSWSDLDGD